jgi:hypothetical protein
VSDPWNDEGVSEEDVWGEDEESSESDSEDGLDPEELDGDLSGDDDPDT